MKLFIYLYLLCLLYDVQASTLISLPFQKIKVNNTSITKRSYHSVASIYNDNQIQYLVNIQVGTPPQEFIVIVDTGSPYFWIPGSDCPKSQCPHTTFTISESSTFYQYSQVFNINYNLGYAKGYQGTDNVTLAGVTITDQIMGVVVDTQDAIQTGIDYDGTSANGILGLSYPDKETLETTGHASSIPFHMMNKDVLANPMFSIYTNSVYAEGWSGTIVLGGYNTSTFKNNHTIHYIPVQRDTRSDNYSLWQLRIESIGVFDQTTNTNDSNDVTALMSVDTGTTFTYVYEDYVRSLLRSMHLLDDDMYDRRSGCFMMDCDYGKHDSPYQVQLQFRNSSNATIQFSVPLRELVEPLDYIDLDKATKCVFTICASDDKSNFIMGDSIIRTMNTIFDMENNQIGFVPTLYTNSTITALP